MSVGDDRTRPPMMRRHGNKDESYEELQDNEMDERSVPFLTDSMSQHFRSPPPTLLPVISGASEITQRIMCMHGVGHARRVRFRSWGGELWTWDKMRR